MNPSKNSDSSDNAADLSMALRQRVAELRESDSRSAPSFDRVLRARSKSAAPGRSNHFSWGLPLAAAATITLAMSLWFWRSPAPLQIAPGEVAFVAPATNPEIEEWTTPSDVLLLASIDEAPFSDASHFSHLSDTTESLSQDITALLQP